jgi:hypothetical protein
MEVDQESNGLRWLNAQKGSYLANGDGGVKGESKEEKKRENADESARWQKEKRRRMRRIEERELGTWESRAKDKKVGAEERRKEGGRNAIPSLCVCVCVC